MATKHSITQTSIGHTLRQLHRQLRHRLHRLCDGGQVSACGPIVYAATVKPVDRIGRLSFALGLHGPCARWIRVQRSTGRIPGLRALQNAECPVALVSGDAHAPFRGRRLAIAGMTSRVHRSHTFDSRAAARAWRAQCDRALLLAGQRVGLMGSAVRQDGRSASLTAPNGQAQRG